MSAIHCVWGPSVFRNLLTLMILVAGISLGAFAQTAVEGTVADSSGKPVAGATASLHRPGGAAVQQTTSDANGKFRFAGVEAGDYVLKVEAANYYASHYG